MVAFKAAAAPLEESLVVTMGAKGRILERDTSIIGLLWHSRWFGHLNHPTTQPPNLPPPPPDHHPHHQAFRSECRPHQWVNTVFVP